MKMHRNARTTPKARALIVQRVDAEGWSVAETAEAFGVSERTVYKWRARFPARGGGVAGSVGGTASDSPPHFGGARCAHYRASRAPLGRRMIARRLRLPRATVGAVLRRRGLGSCPR